MQLVAWFNRNKVQVVAGTALVVFMMLASKGAALVAFRALARFILPIVLLMVLWNLFKKKLRKTLEKSGFGNLGEMYKMQMEKHQPAGKQGPVIDLCPRCGKVAKANHRCK